MEFVENKDLTVYTYSTNISFLVMLRKPHPNICIYLRRCFFLPWIVCKNNYGNYLFTITYCQFFFRRNIAEIIAFSELWNVKKLCCSGLFHQKRWYFFSIYTFLHYLPKDKWIKGQKRVFCIASNIISHMKNDSMQICKYVEMQKNGHE